MRLKTKLFALLFSITFLAKAQLLLDNGTLNAVSTAAYSLRQLKTTYTHAAITPPAAIVGFTNSTTPLIRVRRTVDAGQLDIGYLLSGVLDTTTLINFVTNNGASPTSSGFVTVWYDQSGNSRDVTQTTEVNQPRIVNAGILERSNTKPAIRFIRDLVTPANSSQLVATIPASTMFTDGIIGSALFAGEASGGNSSAWGYGDGNNRWQIHMNEDGGLKFDYGDGYERTAHINSANQGVLRTYVFTAQTGQPGRIYIDGTLVAQGAVPAGPCTSSNFTIGRIPAFTNWNHDDRQSELIMFNNVLPDIDRNIAFEDLQTYYANNQFIWTGATNTAYNVASNWSTGTVPGATAEIIIPSGKPNSLVLTANQTVSRLTIYNGATVTINSGINLNVTGNVDNGGTITGEGTLVLNGSTTQNILTNNGVFGNVEINNTNNVNMPVSGTFNGLVTFTNGRLQINNATSNPVVINTVTFNGGVTGMNATRAIRSSNQTDVVFGGSTNYTVFFDQTTVGTTNRVRNITISGTGIVSLGNAISVVGGDATINYGATLNMGTQIMNRSAAGGTLTVNGTLICGSNTGGRDASNFPNNFNTNTLNGTVDYNMAGAQTFPGLAYTNLTLSGSGNKTFSAGTTISGIFRINSTAVANLGTTTTWTANALLFNTTGQVTGTWGGTGSGAANINTTFFAATTGRITINNVTFNWTGAVNTNWNNTGNWSGATVPTATSNVYIPAAPTNQPTVNVASVCRNLFIETGATVTNNSQTLTVNGDLVNNGTFTLGGTSTLEFAGANTQLILGSFTSTGAITISKTAGTLTLVNNVNAANLTFTASGSTLAINGATLTLTGTLTVNNFANAEMAVTVSGTGTLNCNAVQIGNNTGATSNTTTRTHQLTSSIANFNITNDLTLSSYFVATNRIRNATVTITTGNISLRSIVTTNANAANTSSFILGGSSPNLTINGATPFNLSGTGTNTITLNGAGATVRYNGSATQTVRAATYTNLVLNNSAGVTLGGAITASAITLNNTAITTGGNAITTNTWTNNGGSLSGANTVTFTGTNALIDGTSNTTFSTLVVDNNTNVILNRNATCTTFNFAAGANASSFTHTGPYSLTVTGNVTIPQPSAAVVKEWFINTGSATVNGNLNIATSPTNNPTFIARVTLTTGTLTIGGNLEYNTTNNAGNEVSSVLRITAAGTVNIAGAITVNGTTNRGTLSPGTAGTVNFNGTAAQTIPIGVSAVTYFNLATNNTSVSGATLGAAITTTNVTGNLLVQSGTLNNGGFAIAGNGTRTLQVNNGATLLLGGTTSAFPTGFGTVTLQPTSTVNYAGTGAQTIVAQNYGNLTISSARTTNSVTLANGGTIGIAGVFSPTATFTTGNYITINNSVNFNGTGAQTIPVFSFNNLTVSGARAGSPAITLASGTINVEGNFTSTATGIGSFVTTGNTMNFNGAAQNIGTFTFNNLTAAGTGDKTATGNLTVNGILDINASRTLNMGTNTLAGAALTTAGTGTLTTQNTSTCLALPAGRNWSMTVNYNNATGGQSVLGGTYANLTMGNTSGTNTVCDALTVNGALTVPASTTLNMGTNALAGTLTTAGTGTITTQNTSANPLPAGRTWSMTVNYNNSGGNQSVVGGTYSNLTSGNTSGTNTVTGALTVNNVLTVVANTTLDMGTNTLSGAAMTTSGTGTITTQNTSANPLPAGRTWSMNIEYNNTTGGQTVVGGTYTNLLSGNTSGTNTASGNLTINNQLTVVDGTILNMGTNTIAGATMTTAGTGTIQTQNTSANPFPAGRTWSMTVEYNNATGGQSVVGGTYENLISGLTSGTNTATGALTVNNQLTVRDGTILNMGTNTLSGASLTTSGAGTLQTQNTSANPIPADRNWSMTVSYNSASAQTVVSGNYTNLSSAGGNRTLSSTGEIGISQVFTPGAGTYTTAGSTVNFNGGLQNVPPITGGYNNLSITGTDNKTATGNIGVNGNLFIQDPLIFFMGNNTLTSSGSPMTTSGTGTISTTNTSANPLPSGVNWTVEVRYDNPTGGQTVVGGTYSDLTMNNTSGTNVAGNNFTVNDVLTITNGGTLDMGTNTMAGGPGMTTNGTGTVRTANESTAPLPSGITWTMGVEYYSTNSQYIMPGQYSDLNASGGDRILPNPGTVAINDVFVPGTGNYTSTGSTVLFNGGTQTIPAITGGYNNVSVAGSGDKTAGTTLAINGNIDIATGRTMDMGTHALTGTVTTSGDGLIRTANESLNPLPSDITWNVGVVYYSSNMQYIMPGQYTDLNAVGGNRTLPSSGTVAIADEFVPGSGTFTSTGSTVLFNGAVQTVPGINGGYNNVNIAGSDDKTASSALSINGNLDIASGRILDMGTHALSGTTLTTSGDGVLRTANITATPLPAGISWDIPVDYYAVTGGQSIVTGTYTDLRITNTSGVSTATGNLSISDALTLNGGTFSMGTHALTGSGSISTTGPGTLTTQNTTTTPLPVGQTWNVDVVYNAPTTQTVVSGTYAGNLITSGSASKTLGGSATVLGTLDLSTKLTVGGNTLNLNGDFSGSTTNSLTLNGSSNINIGGSAPAAMSLFIDPTTNGVSNAANNLTYNRIGATITLSDSLHVRGVITPTAGTLNTNNRLILVSNSAGTARILQGTGTYITGNVRAERFIPQAADRAWRFLSSPVSGATLQHWQGEMFVTGPGTGTVVGTINSNGFDATHNNAQTVFSYTESVSGNKNNGWTGATNITNNLVVGRGYRAFVRGDRTDTSRISRNTTTPANDVTLDVVGEVNRGNISMPVSFTSTSILDDDGWNLVGNPYPCPIDWNAFHGNGRLLDTINGTDYTNIESSIWVFNPLTGNYRFYNAVAGAGTLVDGIIGVGQAFWVKASGPSPSMTMRENYKSASAPSEWFKTTPNSLFMVQMARTATEISDEVLVKFMNGASTNYDRFDVLKMPGTVTISAYGSDNKMLALSTRPINMTQNDTIFLSVSGTPNSYELRFTNSNLVPVQDALYLVDNFTSTVVNLRTTSIYNFNITSNAASHGAGRFYIVVSNNSPVPVELMHFDAKLTKTKEVEIKWSTSSEINTSHFELEHSTDGITYEELYRVKATGSQSAITSYTYTDKEPATLNYYRLKMVDNDGSYKYSQVRMINLMGEMAGGAVKLYPVPVSNMLTVSHTEVGIKQIKVVNVWGQTLHMQAVDLSQSAQVDMSKYAAGMYIIEITDENGVTTREQVVKE